MVRIGRSHPNLAVTRLLPPLTRAPKLSPPRPLPTALPHPPHRSRLLAERARARRASDRRRGLTLLQRPLLHRHRHARSPTTATQPRLRSASRARPHPGTACTPATGSLARRRPRRSRERCLDWAGIGHPADAPALRLCRSQRPAHRERAVADHGAEAGRGRGQGAQRVAPGPRAAAGCARRASPR
eukprot:scaffold27200_cov57-Isochrysis_galbana.AAC.1